MRRILHHHNIFPKNRGRILYLNTILRINNGKTKQSISAVLQFRFAPLIAIPISSGEYGITIISLLIILQI